MNFGFTDDKTKFDAAHIYRDAAIADGWTCRPTCSTEPMDSASTLSRDGFSMMILTRDKRDEKAKRKTKWNYEATVQVWGPDGMTIAVPDTYDSQRIVGGARHCNECGADDVDTFRFYFAGRACANCLSAAKARDERGNWTA